MSGCSEEIFFFARGKGEGVTFLRQAAIFGNFLQIFMFFGPVQLFMGFCTFVYIQIKTHYGSVMYIHPSVRLSTSSFSTTIKPFRTEFAKMPPLAHRLFSFIPKSFSLLPLVIYTATFIAGDSWFRFPPSGSYFLF